MLHSEQPGKVGRPYKSVERDPNQGTGRWNEPEIEWENHPFGQYLVEFEELGT
jgi:hypothetical protein